MQSSEIISINIWQILISLCNLLILFLILKRFLFKPVQKMLAARRNAIDEQYSAAKDAEDAALQSKSVYETKLKGAKDEADAIVKKANADAAFRADRMIADAKDKSDSIVNQARTEAKLEKKKAQAQVKKEITDVSTALTEKILEREINADDHRELIDSFIARIGEEE